MTGPRLLTFAEAVGEIAAATGREIRYVPVTPAAYVAELSEHGVPPRFAGFLGDLFATIFDGRNASPAYGVEQALARKPRDFADYVRDAAAAGAWRAG